MKSWTGWPHADTPVQRCFEAVIAPEQFIAADESRRAEDAQAHCALGLLPQRFLGLRAAGLFQPWLRLLAGLLQTCGEHGCI